VVDTWSNSKLIYTRFNFDTEFDFTVCELKKAVKALGPVASKVSQGNHSRIHLPEKATKACLTTFILLFLVQRRINQENPSKAKREYNHWNWPKPL
jgi:hypothetical protein